jgi:hypothetical protein
MGRLKWANESQVSGYNIYTCSMLMQFIQLRIPTCERLEFELSLANNKGKLCKLNNGEWGWWKGKIGNLYLGTISRNNIVSFRLENTGPGSFVSFSTTMKLSNTIVCWVRQGGTIKYKSGEFMGQCSVYSSKKRKERNHQNITSFRLRKFSRGASS